MGIINVMRAIENADDAAVNARIDEIPTRLNAIWDRAEAEGGTPAEVADRMARELIGR